MAEKPLERYTFGRWVIINQRKYYFYWQGKSRKVKAAVEEYLRRNTGLWDTLYNATMNHIAVEYDTNIVSIGHNARNLIRYGIIKADSGPEGLTNK
jgi:hypothetical protein